ncbi:DUF349 domain-containing protein [Thalassotalea mangrovi]|uniref:DUF349 domain-containing protein n=1 Tax=Thalassotalea mangrovi TaxID=2572245 RepID=A0A4U1B3G5_9GAMM|nr:DUF349 domain-containing protein [Thalassotalea mangrovi]TKB43725.1 DUF349 domain-containing protein [Thalassotalea mangrovi]
MIFSNWRKPKWQHADANVRIDAIDELRRHQGTMSQLQQLLCDDPDIRVRKHALMAIESPQLLLSINVQDHCPALVEFAENRIQAHLVSEQLEFSAAQKQDYLQRIRSKKQHIDFMLQWLRREQSEALELYLLGSIDNPVTLIALFSQTVFAKVQTIIIEKTEDEKLLNKLFSRALNNEVKTAIEAKLNTLVQLREQPAKVKKRIKLVLSKLLALRDQHNPEEVIASYKKFVDEWQAQSNDLSLLCISEQQLLLEKQAQIIAILEPHLAKMNELLAHQKSVEEQQAKRINQQRRVDALIDDLHKTIATVIDTNQPLDNLNDVIAELTQMSKHPSLTSVCQKNIDQALATADRFIKEIEHIREQLVAATRLVSQLSERKLPVETESWTEAESAFKDWYQQWQDTESKLGIWLPESIGNAAKLLVNQWLKALKPLRDARQKQRHWFKQRFGEVNGLIHAGKYRAAIAVFNKISQARETISSTEQHRIDDDYQRALHSVEEIKALESFVVVPRKEQLLKELEVLVTAPLADIQAQTDKVKEFRQRWLALGRAEGESEGQLNQAFNRLCEQAFLPCREYYAEQANIREQNLVARQNLLNELSELSNQMDASHSEDFKTFSHRLNQLLNRWRDAGDVDHDKYQPLHQRFRKIVTPMQNSVREWQQANAEAKRQIVIKAENLIGADDIQSSIADLKMLQQQWREIGFAGGKLDKQLWKAFRTANDQAFKRRDAIKNVQHQQRQELQQQWQSQIEELLSKVYFADEHLLKDMRSNAQALMQEINTYRSFNGEFLPKVTEVQERIATRQRQLKKQKQNLGYQLLFDLFASVDPAQKDKELLTKSEQFAQLSKAYQRALLASLNGEADDNSRIKLTVELEIIAQVDSPQEERELRQNLQVAMLKDKLNGAEVSLEEKLLQWISCGPLTEQQQPLLTRTKALFIR